jgi:signal transduction histidine kinase
MRIRFFTGMCMIMCGILVGIAYADKAEDAVSLVDKAVGMFVQQGSTTAIKAINDPQGPLTNGEIYVFAVTMDNILIGHPSNVFSLQINVGNLNDSGGVQIFQKFKETVEKNGSGWVEYSWGKLGYDDLSPRKRSFVKKVPGENVYLGAGYYME